MLSWALYLEAIKTQPEGCQTCHLPGHQRLTLGKRRSPVAAAPAPHGWATGAGQSRGRVEEDPGRLAWHGRGLPGSAAGHEMRAAAWDGLRHHLPSRALVQGDGGGGLGGIAGHCSGAGRCCSAWARGHCCSLHRAACAGAACTQAKGSLLAQWHAWIPEHIFIWAEAGESPMEQSGRLQDPASIYLHCLCKVWPKARSWDVGVPE